MKKFAKLFESEKYGQILARLTDNEETGVPQISVYCHPGDPLDVCETTIKFDDNPDGLKRRDEVLEKMGLEMVEVIADEVFKIAEGFRHA